MGMKTGKSYATEAAARRPDDASPWKEHAEALADWTLARIVVRKDVFGITLPDGRRITGHDPVTRELLVRHYQGLENIGAHLISPLNLCLCLIADVDAHDDSADPDVNWRCVNLIVDTLGQFDLHPLVCDSNGKGGYHVRQFFKKPVASHIVSWLADLIRARLKTAGLPDVEIFPKQGEVTIQAPYGNWVRLPGRHHKREHYTRIYSAGVWLEGDSAVKALVGVAGDVATKLQAEFTAQQPAKSPRGGQGGRKQDDEHPDAAKVREVLNFYSNADVHYDEWIGAGMALNTWDSSQAGLDEWREWSRQSSKYVEGTCEAKWPSFDPNGKITWRSLFKAAVDRGWKPGARAVMNSKPSGNGDGHQDGDINARLAMFARTDIGNGERLAARHGDRLRYCHPWSKWLAWDGRRWSADQVGAVRRMAKDTVRRIYAEAEGLKDDDRRKALIAWGLKSESRDRVSALLDLASTEDGIPVLPEQLDASRWLLNVQNGTLDLKTGKLRPHRREDMMTALSPVGFDATMACPIWLKTLGKIFNRDPSLITFWKRLCGLALTGEVTEQILPILYGTGANGKSTLLGALLEILGQDYAVMAPPGLLLIKNGESNPTERAILFGKRLVVDVESAEGARLNENFVKQLTGSDKITARRMREDFWDFFPTHKVMLCTNHKPMIQETKNAIWRRIKLIPFSVAIPESEQIKDLPKQLRAEYPGILAWCVQGCLEWQRDGLAVPQIVTDATEGYRNEQDVIGEFIEEECTAINGTRAKASRLFERYRRWTERSGEKALTQRGFGMAMTERGFERITNNGTYYLGINLRQDQESADEGSDANNSS